MSPTPSDIGVVRTNPASADPFKGFEPLTGNFLYCPNQFFDVCMPHYSRGVVRLVAFVLRQTLGWLDKNGIPNQQHVRVSYGDIIEKAGVSRGAIRQAIDDAIAGHFIQQTQAGAFAASGVAAASARYMLRWDEGGEYRKDASAFRGFYSGEGHRMPIPNSFFDRITPNDTLAVTKVVGAVLRHTIGYQNQFGQRRVQAPLSYNYIQAYTGIRHRPTLAAALRKAQERGYIHCVTKGRFDPRGGKSSHASVYSIKWLSEATNRPSDSKTEPEGEQFKNRTRSVLKTEPVTQFKNRTHRKTFTNDIHKQQGEPVVAVQFSESQRLLIAAGLDQRTAARLSALQPLHIIQQQIEWLPLRNTKQNALGMLLRAIEENWTPPPQAIAKSKKRVDRQHLKKREEDSDVQEHKSHAERQRRSATRRQLLATWNTLREERRSSLYDLVIERAASASDRFRLLRRRDLNDPATEVLALMATDLRGFDRDSS